VARLADQPCQRLAEMTLLMREAVLLVKGELLAQDARPQRISAVIDQHGALPEFCRATLHGSRRSGNARYCRRTMTLSAEPRASITVRRRKPGPSGSTNNVRRSARALAGAPLTSTVSGSTPPEIFKANGSDLPSRRVSSMRELFGGNMILRGGFAL